MRYETVMRHLRVVARDVLVNTLVSSQIVPVPLRTKALRLVGFRGIHPTARLWPGTFLGSRRLVMHEGAGINYDCFLDLGAETTLGRNCGLGYQVMLLTSSHEIGDGGRRVGKAIAKPITIGEGAWLGARVVVMPGVTIGAGCVVATGSLVTRDLAPHGLYAGSPARRIRDLA